MQASSSTPPLRPKAKLMAQTAGDSPHCICASLTVGADDDDEVDDSSPPCSFSPTGSPPESTGILFRPKAVSPKASRHSGEAPPPPAER